MTHTPRRALPESVGRYRVDSLLGKGGMGEVYKAFDPGFDRVIALKMITPGAHDDVFMDRLRREAKALGRLGQKGHPNIVTVFDLGEADGAVFIAMQYLEGRDLGAAIAHGDLAFDVKLKVLTQVLDALQFAHSEGIIHRDIKPTNIFLLPDNTVKLLDFGLARVARADSLTVTGDVMGTPFYMAPEQLKGQVVDERADIFSTGAVAYELFTHRKAFAGSDPHGPNITEVMLKVLNEDPPPMDTGWSSSLPELERIIRRAMAKSSGERYATAEDMRNALAAFASSSRDAIARVQADNTILAQRAVAEAKTLFASGRVAESQQLLAHTLRAVPEARDVRVLYDETSRHAPVAAIVEPTWLASKSVDVASTFDPAVLAVNGVGAPRAAEAHGAAVERSRHAATPIDRDRSPWWLMVIEGGRARWLVLGAAVVIVSVIALLTLQALAPRQTASDASNDIGGTSGDPVASQRQRVSPAPAFSETNKPGATGSIPLDSNPTAGSGRDGYRAATEPVDSARAPAAPSPPTVAQNLPKSAADLPARQSSQSSVEPGQSNNAAQNAPSPKTGPFAAIAANNAELSRLLKDRVTAMVRERGISAPREVRVSLEIAIRDSGFAGTAAKTADWVATTQSGGTLRTLQGHVLGFSDVMLRDRALEAAATEIVDALAESGNR